MNVPQTAQPQRILQDLQVLTRDIGVRLAGTHGEHAAAEFIAGQFRAAGANVSVEEFPMMAYEFRDHRLGVNINGKWTEFACVPFCHSASTGGQTLEAPLVVFESPADLGRSDLTSLEGAAVLHLGAHFQSRGQYQRLIDSKPAMLLLVDVRYPCTVPLGDSLFPAFCNSVGVVPTINVAYQDAWRWVNGKAKSVRLTIDGGMREARSANVIADFPGDRADPELILCGAHHDTQAGSVGADDNGSGVAGLLELSRLLSHGNRQRTIRLISFGTEEQLSVGSAAYSTKHSQFLKERGRFMFNLDSYGSFMGWTRVSCNGPAAMRDYLGRQLASQGLYAEYREEVTPYADHYPFAKLGIPAVMLRRLNCTSGRFFHHRPDDDLSKIDPLLISRWINGVAHVLNDLGSAGRMPFPAEIPESEQTTIDSLWKELFDSTAL